jgi:hypothetical protein
MNPADVVLDTATEARQICRAQVFKLNPDGTILCTFEDESMVRCEVLQTSDGPSPTLEPNDVVLVWLPDADLEEGVILGRLGARKAAPARPPEPPAELVIEATSQLTLKCGSGSITLRGDGKVLIKGKDLVSHAQRMNRIKGGGVAIN